MSYQQNPLVDQYIAQFPSEVQERLTTLRHAIQGTFPKSVEDISYGIPTYRPEPEKRGFVHFGATKEHIGIYGIVEAPKDHVSHELIAPFRTGKGTLQFKHDVTFPIGKIRRILAFYAGRVDS